MAGGPIFPYSSVPDGSGEVFPNVYSGDGTYTDYQGAMAVAAAADLTADRTWHLFFQMPPSLPSGTCKLVIQARADAITGAAKVNPKWRSVAAEEDPSDTALNAEGTQTITWSTGDDDQVKEAKVTLDADTVVAGELVRLDLVFEDSGFTLAVPSSWVAFIIWE